MNDAWTPPNRPTPRGAKQPPTWDGAAAPNPGRPPASGQPVGQSWAPQGPSPQQPATRWGGSASGSGGQPSSPGQRLEVPGQPGVVQPPAPSLSFQHPTSSNAGPNFSFSSANFQGASGVPPRAQPGWGNGYHPPKPNRAPLAGCAVAGLVVAVIGVVLTIIVASLTPDPVPTPTPEASSSTRTSSLATPSRTPLAPASNDPKSASTRSTTPRAASTSRAHPQADYVNDGYRMPPEDGRNNLPAPQDFDTARNWTDHNALYLQPMASPVRCELDVLDWSNASAEQRRAHLLAFRECLMRAWDPGVRATGYALTTPLVELVGDNVQTPCGSTSTFGGYYCSQNQTIYLNVERHRTIKTATGSILPYVEATFAHEFGHHVQACTGIMWASWHIRGQLGAGEEWNLESRKTELQAQCFSGIALNSLGYSMGFTENDRKEMIQFEYNRNTDAQHGTKHNYGLWWEHGFSHDVVSECNSFRPRNPETLQ